MLMVEELKEETMKQEKLMEWLLVQCKNQMNM